MIDMLLNILTLLMLLIVVLIAFVVVLAWFLRPLQHALVYHPDEPPGSRTRFDGPREFRLPRYELLAIVTSDDFTLRGFAVLPSSAPPRFMIIYFHGNAGNAGHRTPLARTLADRLHAVVVMMDYRCYGLSDSKGTAPDEHGLQRDAKAVLDYCCSREDWSRLPVFIMGTSLGGAVAIYLGSLAEYSDGRVRGWIVENTFTSLSDMADALFGPLILRRFPGWRGRCLVFCLSRLFKPLVIHVGWYSIDAVKKITGPILFISSAKDELVPPQHVRLLHEAAQRSCMRRLAILPDSAHNDAPDAPRYCELIQEFIDEVLQMTSPAIGL